MAKDYMQDIKLPDDKPSNSGQRLVPIKKKTLKVESAAPTPAPLPDMDGVRPPDVAQPSSGERSIRNISMPSRQRARPVDMREAPQIGYGAPGAPRKRSRIWMWGAAILCVLVLGALALMAFRSTTITVTPRSHSLMFDESSRYTAYPAANAAEGTLGYTVESIELEDSAVVESEGTVAAEEKASGAVTVYNNYSAQPVRLIKNTRFQSPNGLIFRAPADIIVPGKKGAVAGSIQVTVVADQAGEQYNIGPVQKFTLPGLKSTADMYAGVYAESKVSMTGGFVGQRPGVAPGALQSAISDVRARLEKKAKESISGLSTDENIALEGLAHIEYEDLPQTVEAGGGVRIREKARVQVPVFPSAQFARTIAETASADASGTSVRLEVGEGFAATQTATTSVLGAENLQFGLAGAARLIWNIDESALTEALAGKDQAAFQAIVKSFPGVQEARARIEPFWKRSFPSEAGSIKVKIQPPTNDAS